jgi:charged multivesicular body protein 5
MDVLKRKKMYEAQRDQLMNQQFNIDQTAFAIETVKNTQITVAAMSAAAKQLKVENKKIDLSEIEDMQDGGLTHYLQRRNCVSDR